MIAEVFQNQTLLGKTWWFIVLNVLAKSVKIIST
jgi:hypothetical protein